MENNPELEKAEIELQNTLHQERDRKKLMRQNKSIPDHLIEFAVLVYFIAGIISPFIFMVTLISISDGARIPKVVLWLILPAGLVSLGTAIGLSRVLEYPKPQTEQHIEPFTEQVD